LAEPGRGRRHVATLVDFGDEAGHHPLRLALGTAHRALEVALLAGLVTPNEHADAPARRTSLLQIALHRNLPGRCPSGDSGWPTDGQRRFLQGLRPPAWCTSGEVRG